MLGKPKLPKIDADLQMCIDWGIPWGESSSFGQVPSWLIERRYEVMRVVNIGNDKFQKRLEDKRKREAALAKMKPRRGR